MNTKKTLTILSILIAIGAAVAAGAGVLWQGQGDPIPYTNVRGDPVLLHGRGLYRYDGVSGAAQLIGGDKVTLLVGIPLLLISLLLAARGAGPNSLRGQLLLSGTLGYFLYTYTSIAFLAALNPLFLLYVALFSLSLFAFVLSLISIDLKELPARFTRPLPHGVISGFLFFVGTILTFLWIGTLILPYIRTGQTPNDMEHYTTLVIQALDLGLIVPTTILTGVLLLRRHALGYLLASVVLVKAFTMSAALISMMIGQMSAGVEVPAFVWVLFSLIGLVDAALMVVMLRSLGGIPATTQRAAIAAGQKV